LPSIQEQNEIIKRISKILKLTDSFLEQYLENAEELEQLDQSILAKAFRGELVPQDPNDEPAAVLLARIRAERERLGGSKKRGKAKA
jgi:type I restriction enzyme S subunit